MNEKLLYLANKLPLTIKKPLRHLYGAIPPSMRYGKTFWETFKFLQESQWWSREKLEEYQMQQLTKLLNQAYQNVPYYTKIFDERGLKPKNIQNINDLSKLPYLTKDDFRNHFCDLVARNVTIKNLPLSHTSGTSGKPLQFYTSQVIGQKELAFIFHQWSRVGYTPESSRVEIRGSIINRGNPAEYNPITKVLRLSPRISDEGIAKYYLDRINRFNTKFIHGYPSAIASFAHTIKKHSLDVSFQLKAVLFASEVVYDWERELVCEVFKCRVFSHYGMAEQVVLAAECETSSHYHCLPQYGITELDPQTHEIIGTGFLNDITPLIRYRTTDVASGEISHCGSCKRAYYPVFEKVEGRFEDYIITTQGLISPAIITHPFKDLKTIKNTQIVQKSLYLIILRIVLWDEKEFTSSEIEIKRLIQDLKKILGDDMIIEIEVKKEIETTVSGKFKWIISDISNNMLKNGLS